MRLEFQKNIASSQFTLPIVSIIGVILWLILPTAHTEQTSFEHLGLWSLVPESFSLSPLGKYASLVVSGLCVYMIAELTNANVLLRISSRMLSSTLATILGITLCMHILTPGHVVMVFVLLSFFTLFNTYQMPHPTLTLATYIMLTLGALVFPKLIYFVPVYWGFQIYLRSFTLRTLLASFFGILMPCWLFFGISFCVSGDTEFFVNTCKEVINFQKPDYATLQLTDILIFAFLCIILLFGIVDFYTNAYLDKTRTRIIYNVIIAHAIISVIFMVIQPQHFHTLLPIIIVDSSLVGGHFIALTYNKFSHFYLLFIILCIIALLLAQIIL